mmetsp:Transcript_9628/g.22114  ORF Transcript_9628/g.22114 Transcript_9628/m.22114 type:complete len:220 (-) Transcript_9628:139-798(-)
MTLRVEKPPVSDRDIVCLAIETPIGHFRMKLTADHHVLVRGPSDVPVPWKARELVQNHRDVFATHSFQPLVSAELQCERTRVVKVVFQNPEQRVLAWLPPRGRRRPQHLLDEAAFCCFGSPHASVDFAKLHPELCVRGTFFDNAIQNNDMVQQRALSEGAKPRSEGTWSLGVEKNHERNPSLCHICPFHSSGKRPCVKGAGCSMCHAPHKMMGEHSSAC